jgi:peroxiredoxin family protein
MAAKMLIFCGSDAPQKAFPPFMLGSGALATEMELTLFFTMSGLNIVRKGGAERVVGLACEHHQERQVRNAPTGVASTTRAICR